MGQVKILKARYFPNHKLFDATKGCRASWGWNSLLLGLDLIRSKSRWQVNNGRSVDVWKDNWLPGKVGGIISPIGGSNRFTPLTVSTLIDQNDGTWKLSHLAHVINEADSCAIHSIPLCNMEECDRLIWPLEEDGCYSVRTGYHTIFRESLKPDLSTATCSTIIDKELWKTCWKINTPPKVRTFIWKALKNILPLAANLKNRHITHTGVCKVCGLEEETLEHCLLLCPWTACTWFGSALDDLEEPLLHGI